MANPYNLAGLQEFTLIAKNMVANDSKNTIHLLPALGNMAPSIGQSVHPPFESEA